jgi:hypothetical protein
MVFTDGKSLSLNFRLVSGSFQTRSRTRTDPPVGKTRPLHNCLEKCLGTHFPRNLSRETYPSTCQSGSLSRHCHLIA